MTGRPKTSFVAALVGALILSGCSGADSAPTLPQSICWGAFSGDSVEPLLPDGDEADVKVPVPAFALFGGRGSTYCRIFVDGKESFLAWAQVRNSGNGTGWNHWGGREARPVEAGDEGFLWSAGASSVIRCERPGSRGGPSAEGQKYVELAVVAQHVSPNKGAQIVFISLVRRYVAFARQALKCA